MYTLAFLTALAPLLAPALGAPSCAKSGAGKAAGNNGKAVYVMANQATNAVIAVPIAANGLLSAKAGSSTATGGAGASGIDSATNESAGPDALFSQSSLKVAGNVCKTSPDLWRLLSATPSPTATRAAAYCESFVLLL